MGRESSRPRTRCQCTPHLVSENKGLPVGLMEVGKAMLINEPEIGKSQDVT